MPLDPEAIYRELGQLLAEIPTDLSGPGAISNDTHRWLARSAVLVEESLRAARGLNTESIFFTTAVDGLAGPLRETNAHQIISIVHRALARAESQAPAAVRGAFIAVGAGFDVFQTIGAILREATLEVLVVDPYLDATVLTDFAPLVANAVTVRLLTDSYSTKAEALERAVRYSTPSGNPIFGASRAARQTDSYRRQQWVFAYSVVKGFRKTLARKHCSIGT